MKPLVKKVDASGVEVFEIDIPTDEDEVDSAWKNLSKQLDTNKVSRTLQRNGPDEKTKREDGTKEFRTKVVLAWIMSNLLLIAVFTNEYTTRKLFPVGANSVSPYLGFLFWSVAFLSTIRFIGSCVYIFQWWTEKVVDAKKSLSHHIA